jgi:hypothetical protein
MEMGGRFQPVGKGMGNPQSNMTVSSKLGLGTILTCAELGVAAQIPNKIRKNIEIGFFIIQFLLDE